MADVVRERLRSVTEKVVDEEKLKAALELAFDATKRYVCVHCHRSNSVPMPDIGQIEKILNQIYGPMPAPEQVVHHDVTLMTLDQRLAYLAELQARRESLALPSGNGDGAAD